MIILVKKRSLQRSGMAAIPKSIMKNNPEFWVAHVVPEAMVRSKEPMLGGRAVD